MFSKVLIANLLFGLASGAYCPVLPAQATRGDKNMDSANLDPNDEIAVIDEKCCASFVTMLMFLGLHPMGNTKQLLFGFVNTAWKVDPKVACMHETLGLDKPCLPVDDANPEMVLYPEHEAHKRAVVVACCMDYEGDKCFNLALANVGGGMGPMLAGQLKFSDLCIDGFPDGTPRQDEASCAELKDEVCKTWDNSDVCGGAAPEPERKPEPGPAPEPAPSPSTGSDTEESSSSAMSLFFASVVGLWSLL